MSLTFVLPLKLSSSSGMPLSGPRSVTRGPGEPEFLIGMPRSGVRSGVPRRERMLIGALRSGVRSAALHVFQVHVPRAVGETLK